MKQTIVIFSLFLVGYLVVTGLLQRKTCTDPVPQWIDRNHDGIQQSDEFIIALGECTYQTTYAIGWPSFVTIGIINSVVEPGVEWIDFSWFKAVLCLVAITVITQIVSRLQRLSRVKNPPVGSGPA